MKMYVEDEVFFEFFARCGLDELEMRMNVLSWVQVKAKSCRIGVREIYEIYVVFNKIW